MSFSILRTLAPALAMTFVACLASPELSPAGTDLSNVAWKQPVTGNSYGQPWYGRAFAANADGYTVVGPGDAARVLINDEFTGAYGWAYPNADGGGAWIDLGAEYDIARIELIPKYSSDWNKLQLATVYGSSQKTTDAEYSFVIPTKSSSDASHVQITDKWRGVRWIRVVDETDTIGVSNKLTIGEVRVFAPVATYGAYIGGVMATATSTYNSPLIFSPDYLVGNTGMTDQHGPVGNPSAKSIANAGLWMTADRGTGGFLDQSVTFDLGGTHSLSGMAVWNFNRSTWSTSSLSYVDTTTRGIAEALIEYSQDGGDTFVALADANGAAAGNYTIAKASTGSSNAPIENSYQLSVNLAGLAADYIRITVKGNHGNSTYAGLSEVRFYGTSLVPDVPGDTNGDAIVDATDSRVLGGYWGASVAAGDASKGDFNGDGLVDATDATILAAHWGDHRYGHGLASGEAAGASAVPEPSVAALLTAMVLLALVRRRRSNTA